ncbi:MAG: hypothetical protein K6F94_05885 [Bacteroidaceae bacterium]|nr:hypothetical protein [Bacteroidaceae bacterium]
MIVYRSTDYLRQSPLFSGRGFGLVEKGINTQFPLLLIPGETLTLDIDLPAVTARDNKLADGKVTMRDCYRVGGTIGDINQVLLENQGLGAAPCGVPVGHGGRPFHAGRGHFLSHL